MKKITIIEYTEKWTIGGIESYILNIVRLIDKEKFNIRIVVSQKESDFYDEELNEYGVHVANLLNRLESNPIKRIMRNMYFFEHYLLKNSCDILHLHVSQGVALRYAKIAKKIGVKRVISHCHSTGIGDKDRFVKLIGHKIGKKIYQKYCDERIACSELAAQWLYTKRDIYENVVKIYKCIIDVDYFRYSEEDSLYMREKYGLENRKICLNVGRLSYEKNQLFLLDIFYEMLKLDKDYILIIIGIGELKNQIHKKVSELKIENKVIFIESTKEIEKYLSMANLFLLPSLFEGNPITGIEAQASGLPCYFSDNITKQAKILDSSHFIKISDSAEMWAKKIIKKQCEFTFERTQSIKKLKENGYNQYAQIKDIEKMYFL
ncbi:MAG: glycosyltransferase family 1 protein [Lachnospiraceae bacterium]|jgi:glycosyltransferase involved in cell wall biosynthesis|nr:glycosyltransferase family 1 protein [Lachnospiraceae bacterium]